MRLSFQNRREKGRKKALLLQNLVICLQPSKCQKFQQNLIFKPYLNYKLGSMQLKKPQTHMTPKCGFPEMPESMSGQVSLIFYSLNVFICVNNCPAECMYVWGPWMSPRSSKRGDWFTTEESLQPHWSFILVLIHYYYFPFVFVM